MNPIEVTPKPPAVAVVAPSAAPPAKTPVAGLPAAPKPGANGTKKVAEKTQQGTKRVAAGGDEVVAGKQKKRKTTAKTAA